MNNVARPLFFILTSRSIHGCGWCQKREASILRHQLLKSDVVYLPGKSVDLAENLTTSNVYHSVSTASGDVHHRMITLVTVSVTTLTGTSPMIRAAHTTMCSGRISR